MGSYATISAGLNFTNANGRCSAPRFLPGAPAPCCGLCLQIQARLRIPIFSLGMTFSIAPSSNLREAALSPSISPLPFPAAKRKFQRTIPIVTDIGRAPGSTSFSLAGAVLLKVYIGEAQNPGVFQESLP